MATSKRVLWGAIILLGALILFTTFYNPNSKVTGNVINEGTSKQVQKNIEIKGSDTMLQLTSNLAEAYAGYDPNTRISVTGGGSGTGIAALLNKEIPLAIASREIKSEELSIAENEGLHVIEIEIARDMLSVIVNEENNVGELTKDQVGAIYRGEITNWNEVGGKDQAITLYGRQSTSGTYAFFQEEVLEGEYSPSMRNLEGNQAILESTMQDNSGIGYVGIGYIKDENGNQVEGINVINVAEKEGSEYISPLDKTKTSEYPISRFLYQYLAETPAQDSPTQEFLKFELSEQGQKIVDETGFISLSEKELSENLEKLGL